jgi:hypothetical protein
MNLKYTIHLLAGLLAYALGLIVMNWYIGNPPSHYGMLALPILAIIYIVTTIISYVAQLDEMKRKIVTEAAAFSCVATGFTCFSYLFLRDAGAPEFRAQWAFYLMMAYYWIGLFVSWRRYW